MTNELQQLAVELEQTWPERIEALQESGVPTALTTDNGKDVVSRTLGGADLGRTGTGAGVSYTATTLTDTGAAFPVSSGGPPQKGGLVGCVVVSGTVYGIVVANTATVLTVDFWHNATNPNTVGTTPSAAAAYIVTPAGGPSWYIGLSQATRAVAAADAFLTNDGTTISEVWNSGGALNRKAATFAHTNGTNSYTLQFAATANASDGASNTVNKIGVFQHGLTAAPTTTTTGQMLFTTAVTSPPTLVSGDSLTVTDTITIT